VPHVPQFRWLVDVSTQLPPHLVKVSGQPTTQLPPVQTSPAGQTLPHEPQLPGSDDVDTHVPTPPASPQTVVPGAQTHVPPVHPMPPVQG
jgi:hypothetical protein